MTDNPDRLVLTVDWPEITMGRLSKVSGVWAGIVQGVTRSVTGQGSAVKWVILEIHHGSPLHVVVVPKRVSTKVEPTAGGRVSKAIVEGIHHLQSYADRPPMFSDRVMHQVRRMARFSDPHQSKAITVSNGTAETAEIGSRVAANVESVFGPVVESYGSVEGRLEGVFVHGVRRFFVYDSLTSQQVRCDFGNRIPLVDILAAFEKRVSVTGIVRARARTGERLSVQAHLFRVFRPDSDLTPTDRILEEWQRL